MQYSVRVNLLHELPLRDGDGFFRVVVEVPRGSSVKLKYDPELGIFNWSRALSLGVRFPYDFGFLPQTVSGDDDALDVLVLAMVPSYPGVVVTSRIIGALKVEQQRPNQPCKRNDRLIAIPTNAHRSAHIETIDHVPERVRDEIQAFFDASLLLTGKNVRFCGWADALEACALVEEAHQCYLENRQP